MSFKSLWVLAIALGTGTIVDTSQSFFVAIASVISILVALTGGVWKVANALNRIHDRMKAIPRHEFRLNDHGDRLHKLDSGIEATYNEYEG